MAGDYLVDDLGAFMALMVGGGGRVRFWGRGCMHTWLHACTLYMCQARLQLRLITPG